MFSMSKISFYSFHLTPKDFLFDLFLGTQLSYESFFYAFLKELATISSSL
jgi:hypothetical protein